MLGCQMLFRALRSLDDNLLIVVHFELANAISFTSAELPTKYFYFELNCCR